MLPGAQNTKSRPYVYGSSFPIYTHACLHDLVCFTASVKLSVKEIIKKQTVADYIISNLRIAMGLVFDSTVWCVLYSEVCGAHMPSFSPLPHVWKKLQWTLPLFQNTMCEKKN